MPQLDDGIHGEAKPAPTEFSRVVRLLAVAHGLSLMAGPLGFFLLSGTACFLWVRQGLVFDRWVLGLWLAGLACPLVCAGFRWGFENWCRRHWPHG